MLSLDGFGDFASCALVLELLYNIKHRVYYLPCYILYQSITQMLGFKIMVMNIKLWACH